MGLPVKSRAGFAAGVLGAALLCQLALTAALFTADRDFTYFLGQRINYVCAARARYGIPCPTCGLTRGFVLTVHGKPADAWQLSPTGPLAVFGILGVAAMLLLYAALARRTRENQLFWMQRAARTAALAYAGAAIAIWAGSWLSTVAKMKGYPGF